jgi:pyruvate/2-oxoglutarate dehydrogenase complex dihydrolipoamide acyltransferase (E2) component
MFFVVMPVRDKPWNVDGKVEVRPILRICGTFDHRVLDGRLSGLIANEVKILLSDPTRLLTEAERAEWAGLPKLEKAAISG